MIMLYLSSIFMVLGIITLWVNTIQTYGFKEAYGLLVGYTLGFSSVYFIIVWAVLYIGGKL